MSFSIEIPDEHEFTNKDASALTENFLKSCREQASGPIFIIFDEIENISRNTAPASHWCSGIDFALFWQSLRSIFQRNQNLISYLIVGTNPTCIETAKIDNVDNPIFNHFTPLYIPGFDVRDTREMTRKLGKRMGIKFDESLYAKLTDDFGGHPFLMRHVCSLIASEVAQVERPVDVGRNTYNQSRDNFIQNHSSYLEMIMSVLRDFYPDEFEMLTMLANDDIATFEEFADLHPSYTSHLIGYGIIKKDRSSYDFNIDSIKDYILKQSKYRKIGLTQDEMWAEISLRRNAVEKKLRRLVKILLRANRGASQAKEDVLNIFGGKRKTTLTKLSYDDLFDASKSEIYFSDLSKIISKHWPVFNNTFETAKHDMFSQLEFINASRNDAHAKDLTAEQFSYFRICMDSIESDLEKAM